MCDESISRIRPIMGFFVLFVGFFNTADMDSRVRLRNAAKDAHDIGIQ
jgi:hypothetical protein